MRGQDYADPVTMIKTYWLYLLAAVSMCGCATSRSRPDAEVVRPGTGANDHVVFQSLLTDHAKITRTVREIDGGIEAVTESDDPRIAGLIQEHAAAMKARIEAGRRVRQWDPLFVAVFDAHEHIRLEIEKTPRGILARETSDDPGVTRLIRAHAGVVSGFVGEGDAESARAHPVPRGTTP